MSKLSRKESKKQELLEWFDRNNFFKQRTVKFVTVISVGMVSQLSIEQLDIND